MTEQKTTFKEAVKIFAKAINISFKARGVMSIIISLIGFITAFLPVLTSLLVRNFSDRVQTLSGSSESAFVSALGVFLILSAFYIVQLIWNSVNNYFENYNTKCIQRYMKERVLRCACDVKYKYIENYDNFKQRINFVYSNAGEKVANSVGVTITWIQNVITFVSIVIVLWAVDVWIVVILIATCIPAFLIASRYSEEAYYSRGFWILEYLMACAYFFESTMSQSINDVRFLGAYPWLKKKFDKKNEEYIKIKNRVTKKHVFFNGLSDIFRSCVYVFILLITARRIFDDPAIGIGTFMLVFTMSGQLQDVTAKILTSAAEFISDAMYMRDFFELDDLEYETRDQNTSAIKHYDVDFENVSFTYPDSEREVLHNVSVHICEGEKVAIVGENGSGKTTFINLLCALYEPESGTVKIGAKDVSENVSATRKTLSAVFQDFSKYEASIRDNITVSDIHRNANDIELELLARRTGAWEFVEQQPNKFDEVVGSFSATGNNLSGGQWQKIALTRCAYRDDAKIMILDEPTAALDPVAEADLYRNFAELTGDRTTILISHRLGITRLVDRILVFDDGRIVEDGDHDTLMKKNGLYAKMYEAQARWYMEDIG